MKKKSAEAPEIEKEVKRLLRADNEAISVTWEVIQEEDEHAKPEPGPSSKPDRKTKKEAIKAEAANQSSSKVEDIFGGALSDSDLEEENVNVDVEDSHLSSYGDHFSDSSAQGPVDLKGNRFATQFSSDMFNSPHTSQRPHARATTSMDQPGPSMYKRNEQYSTDEYMQHSSDNVTFKMQQLGAELEELKQRRQRTQLEISGMENMTLRQRFQDILQTLNKDIMYKEIEYQKLQSLLK